MRYYGKKVIILLDEYDTPMQEAYVGGDWNELAAFTRSQARFSLPAGDQEAKSIECFWPLCISWRGLAAGQF